MNTIVPFGVFAVLIVVSIFGVLYLDHRLEAKERQMQRKNCDACLSGGGVTMLPSGARHTLCDEHQARLLRIMELESKMDGDT